jgi:phospholipid/cholesterol/gamma-HCH transport system permease protein
MSPKASLPDHTDRWTRGWGTWLHGWWKIVFVGAQILVLAVSPSSYHLAQRRVMFKHLVAATATQLPGFTALSALVSLIIIRIVVATTLSYGLSQYALELLVRTLVLELLPLSVALFVAVRFTMPQGQLVRDMRRSGELDALWRAGGDPTRDALLPRVGAGVFAVVLLAVVSCVVALILTYINVYGFRAWGLPGYTRSVGQVFSPVVTLIFCIKTGLFSLAVSIIPIVYTPQTEAGDAQGANAEVKVLARLFSVLLMIEALSLLGNYY